MACSLGLAARQGWRFFRPATSGGFGAVAGLARLRGFDAARTLAAFGMQLGQASGTMQAHTEGSPLLPLQIGFNARAAIQSCDLAAAGFPGLDAPFEGRFGYLPLFEGAWDCAPVLAELGQVWRVTELSHKPFPSGRATHGGVDAVMALRAAHGFGPEDVEAITIAAPPLINQLVNRPALPAPTAAYARLCLPFVLAKLLQHGRIELSQFRGAALAGPGDLRTGAAGDGDAGGGCESQRPAAAAWSRCGCATGGCCRTGWRRCWPARRGRCRARRIWRSFGDAGPMPPSRWIPRVPRR